MTAQDCHWSLQPLICSKTCCKKLCEMIREEQSIYLQSQVLLSCDPSALIQEDMALTEAAYPLSKSNYDNHASGKPPARRPARWALIQQDAYLNHSSPPLQTPASANVDGPLKRHLSSCEFLWNNLKRWHFVKHNLLLRSCLFIKGDWRCFCVRGRLGKENVSALQHVKTT